MVANSKEADQSEITLRHLFLALAKDVPANEDGSELMPNPYKNWSDIDPSLPNKPIEVLGPPPTSGTRDAFAELALEGGCKTFDGIKAIKQEDKKKYKAVCHAIREDGAYVEAGENDVLIVQKLVANPAAYGVFGYSFPRSERRTSIQGSKIDAASIRPSRRSRPTGVPGFSRSLYFYVKDAHVGVDSGHAVEFTWSSSRASRRVRPEFGYLADKGLIPSPKDEERELRSATKRRRGSRTPNMARRANNAPSALTDQRRSGRKSDPAPLKTTTVRIRGTTRNAASAVLTRRFFVIAERGELRFYMGRKRSRRSPCESCTTGRVLQSLPGYYGCLRRRSGAALPGLARRRCIWLVGRGLGHRSAI